jgi:hypothetical protein
LTDFDITDSVDGDVLPFTFTGLSTEKDAHPMTKRYFDILGVRVNDNLAAQIDPLCLGAGAEIRDGSRHGPA